jgi:hypothetical protein
MSWAPVWFLLEISGQNWVMDLFVNNNSNETEGLLQSSKLSKKSLLKGAHSQQA